MPPVLEDDDTIIVKGEYRWDRPSSPDSMGQEMEPVVGSLAQAAPQHLESPEPLDDSPTLPNQKTDSRPVYQTPTSNKRQRANVTTMEERLQAMPEKRPLPWRPGVEPGAEIETGGDSRRKQIRFGCLLATRGDVMPVPCVSCANGRGKFRVCVALEGYFKGACASCQLSGRPNRCSIKQSDDAVQSPHVETPEASFSGVQPQPSFGEPTQYIAPQAKRMRINEVPEWESARPQWEQELGISQARQQTSDLVVGQPWATVNHPAPSQNLKPAGNGHNSASPFPSHTFEHPSSIGWATVNQPSRTTPVLQTNNAGESNGSSLRRNLEHEVQEETVGNEEGSVALIDTLPKNKQRQVYGLVSGIQGGIEHLQRELDSLKRALGIDDED